jgi:hypothetical protein
LKGNKEMNVLNEQLIMEKWAPMLDEADLGAIKDPYKRAVTAILLENEERALVEAAPTNVAGGVAGYDPVLINMVRRAAPNMLAFDVCGVQPMTTPTGLVFAMRSRYTNQSGTEALFDEADAGFAGAGGFWGTTPNGLGVSIASAGAAATVTIPTADATALSAAAGATAANYPIAVSWKGTYAEIANQAAINTGTGVITLSNTSGSFAGVTSGDGVHFGIGAGNMMSTATGEGDVTAKMAFSIEKVSVTAQSYQVATGYSVELMQDMKALHGLDAEVEVSKILSQELLAEANRRVLRTIYNIAKPGAQKYKVPGQFDLTIDSDGRWSNEKFKGMLFAIERDSNAMAQDHKFGKGNILICSGDVASALAAAGVLDYAPALAQLEQLNADFTQNTFVGTMSGGRMKVYVDPYATGDFYVVGYKGDQYKAGLFYTPYVAAQMLRATDPASFQPLLAMKVRAGLVCNPFTTVGGATMSRFRSNGFYRIAQIKNLVDLTA